MTAGGAPGGAHQPDCIRLSHLITDQNCDLLQVVVRTGDAFTMIDDHSVPVAPGGAGERHLARTRGTHRGAARVAEVDAAVEGAAPIERVGTIAESGSDQLRRRRPQPAAIVRPCRSPQRVSTGGGGRRSRQTAQRDLVHVGPRSTDAGAAERSLVGHRLRVPRCDRHQGDVLTGIGSLQGGQRNKCCSTQQPEEALLRTGHHTHFRWS